VEGCTTGGIHKGRTNQDICYNVFVVCGLFSPCFFPHAEAMACGWKLAMPVHNLPKPVRPGDATASRFRTRDGKRGFLPEALRQIVKSVGRTFTFWGLPWIRGLCLLHVEGQDRDGFAAVKSFLTRAKTFRACSIASPCATIPYLQAQIAAGATAYNCSTLGGETEFAGYEDSSLPAVQEINRRALGARVP